VQTASKYYGSDNIPIKYLDSMTNLDDLVFQEEKVFELPENLQIQLCESFIKEAFEYHYKTCESYKLYCNYFNISPADINSYTDLSKIPLIPTSVFKRRQLLSCHQDEIEKRCLSSGTQGGKSIILRDRLSLERFLGTVKVMYQMAPDSGIKHPFLYVLSPDAEEAGDLWFAYVLSMVEIMYPAKFYVRDSVFKERELLDDILKMKDSEQPVIIAPPAVLINFCEIVRKEVGTIDLGSKNAYILTAGGWKKAQGQSVDRDEYEKLVMDTFLLRSKNEVRDCFNMVEMNTVIMSCEHNSFHLPPWLYMNALDPTTLKPLKDGEIGILGFCDALANSYPAFVLSDDFGMVYSFNTCPCGRPSRWFKPIRRLSRVENRGCARKIDSLIMNT
jgi:long-chain-fatty-acid---luciferin-component ligase